MGPLIAVTYVLTLEDAERFAHSRDVGAYLGLTRKQRDSGESQPELGISKAGDRAATESVSAGGTLHSYAREGRKAICGCGGWGRHDGSKRGGKRAKKRAIVAVARKLAVLLHHLWATGEVYDPQYNRKAAEAKAKGKGEVAA